MAKNHSRLKAGVVISRKRLNCESYCPIALIDKCQRLVGYVPRALSALHGKKYTNNSVNTTVTVLAAVGLLCANVSLRLRR